MSSPMNLTLPDDLYQKVVKDVKSGFALSSQERIRQIVAMFYSGEGLRPAAPAEAETAKGGA